MDFEKFSARVRRLMNEKSITQKTLARKIGFSEGTLSRYLHGDMRPSVDALIGMAKIFGVSVDWLIGLQK